MLALVGTGDISTDRLRGPRAHRTAAAPVRVVCLPTAARSDGHPLIIGHALVSITSRASAFKCSLSP